MPENERLSAFPNKNASGNSSSNLSLEEQTKLLMGEAAQQVSQRGLTEKVAKDGLDLNKFTTNFSENSSYDVITLPSLGKVYTTKKSKLSIAYLNASDEDLLTSPNLYQTGEIIPRILRKKILDRNVDPESLVQGDIDKILIFLRLTSYGKEYPIKVFPPKGEPFDTTVDLTRIKEKEILQEPDEEGLFSVNLPNKGDFVKYKILSYREEKQIKDSLEDQKIAGEKHVIYSDLQRLEDHLNKEYEWIKKNDLRNLITTCKNDIAKNIKSEGFGYTKNITAYLERQIVEVNGKRDTETIRNYVKNLPIVDSKFLRNHIIQNTPGMDLYIDVLIPGGGSFKTFLTLGIDLLWDIS